MRERDGRGPEPRDERTSFWDRLEGIADIAPVQGDPSLDPANEPWEVAMMAGWGDVQGDGRGFDAMMGVGRMATGESDAMRELEVESATEGGPLTLARNEDMDTSIDPRRELGFRDPMGGDWTSHL